MDYNFIEAQDATIENEGMLFGIEWFNEDGDLIGTDWYATEDERNEAVDHWFADQDEYNPEQ